MGIITLYTGRTRTDGTREDLAARITFESWLINEFGGFTRVDSWGGWESPDGLVIWESGFVYTILKLAGTFDRTKGRQITQRALLTFDQQEILYTLQYGAKGGLEYGSVTA